MLQIDALKRMADDGASMMETSREQGQTARRYYNSQHYTAADLAILKRRKQPIVWENLIRRKVDALVGLEMQGRVDPKALPRQPEDEEAAEIATRALVFADDIARFDQKRSQVVYNLAIEGCGGMEVVVRQSGDQIDPELIRLRWEEIIYDPFSREADFSDAQYMGVVKWVSVAQALEILRPYAEGMTEEALAGMVEASLSIGGATYDDRPSGEAASWGDKRGKRVKIAYLYYRHEGTWHLAAFCGGGEVYNQPSPYLDQDGKPDNAIILQSTYVDEENGRHGIVLDMIPMQNEVNKRRSKILHQINSRQTKGHAGAFPNHSDETAADYIRREMAKPDGHIQYEQDPTSKVPGFEIIPQTDQIAGQFQLLLDSKQALQNLGPNASLLGQLSGQQSGRAILAQQQAGMAELAPFYDAIRDFSVRVYRAIWNRIRQFWTQPRWVRVTDEDGTQFFGVNIRQVDEFGQVSVQNRLAEVDVDIIIDAAQDYITLQAEQFETLSKMQGIPPDVLIEASSLPNKQKLLERMKDPQAQEQQQAAMQAQMAEFQARLRDLEASAAQKAAAAGKLQAETAKIASEIGAPVETGGDDVRAVEAAERLAIDRSKAEVGNELTRAQAVRTMAEAERTAVETRLAPARAAADMQRRAFAPNGGQR